MSSTIENRMRKAINATAEQVSADSLPPMRDLKKAWWLGVLPKPGAFSGGGLGLRWLSPVATAVAVALIAAAVLVISSLASSSPLSVQSVGATVPPYYAALTYKGEGAKSSQVTVTIRATSTGKVLATVVSPLRGFEPRALSAAADDRTFVMAVAQPGGFASPDAPHSKVRFYRLSFDPATSKVEIRRLPITDVTIGNALAMSLSPDGRLLAVTADEFDGIRVYTVPGGAERSWKDSKALGIVGPAWAGGTGALAYYRDVPPTEHSSGLYLLNPASHQNLRAASHAVPAGCAPAWYAPSPALIVCVNAISLHNVDKDYLSEESLRTGRGRLISLPGATGDATAEVAWANPAGTKVIVLIGKPSGASASAYLVTGHRSTRLPGATWAGDLSIDLPAAW